MERAGDAYRGKDPAGWSKRRCASMSAIMLQSLDTHWREHLAALDHLRQGIHLRGYAQKNPKQEYKREAFELFGMLLESVKLEVTRTLMTVQIRSPRKSIAVPDEQPALENVQYQHADSGRRALPASRRRRMRACASGRGAAAAFRARRQGRPQRSLSLRIGQEIQALPRQAGLNVMAVNLNPPIPKQLLAGPGVELGFADGGRTQKPGRKDLLLMRLIAEARGWRACSRRTASVRHRSPFAASIWRR